MTKLVRLLSAWSPAEATSRGRTLMDVGSPASDARSDRGTAEWHTVELRSGFSGRVIASCLASAAQQPQQNNEDRQSTHRLQHGPAQDDELVTGHHGYKYG